MDYIYLNKYHCIYDTKFNQTRNTQEVYLHTGLKPNLLREKILSGELKSYNDLTYSYNGEDGKFNLLDKESILDRGNKDPCYDYKLHPFLEKLFFHICGGKKENIDYLHKCILHKYKNIDDVFVPCIIFHGSGGTGKNSLLNLLSFIFGKDNTQILDGKSLHSNFTPYTGKKIIVAYDEVESNGYNQKTSTLAYLKSVVFSEEISVEEKYQKRIHINSIAWFFLLSNSSMPINLDEKEKGNRRFTVIRSDLKLSPMDGELINNIVNQNKAKKNGNYEFAKKVIKDYLWWLEYNYGNEADKRILALENEEKSDLEEKSESVGNLFFERFQEKYPDIKRFTIKKFNYLLNEYRKFCGDDADPFDDRYKPKYFNLGLSIKYQCKVVYVDGISHRMYIIKDKQGKDFSPLNP